MNIEDLVERIEKLEYQISLLTEAVDFQKFPVEYLILTMNWTEQDLDRVHGVFENYESKIEAGESINSGKFESDLGTDYQSVKRIVRAFYKNDQWVDVCVAYVKSLGTRVPTELQSILKHAD